MAARNSLRIRLVQPPFASYFLPSIPLTMLKSVVRQRFGHRVDVRVVYINFDVARHMGLDLYEEICLSGEHFGSGLAEWFFRQAAFPQLDDNADGFFQRFYPGHDRHTSTFKHLILEKRAGIGIDSTRSSIGTSSPTPTSSASTRRFRKTSPRSPAPDG